VKKWKKLGKNTEPVNKKELQKKINFCCVCILFFFGISEYWFIIDYLSLPKSIGGSYFVNSIIVGYEITNFSTNFWVISLGDGLISNIELYIIFVLMLWGFMRVVDLLFLMKNY